MFFPGFFSSPFCLPRCLLVPPTGLRPAEPVDLPSGCGAGEPGRRGLRLLLAQRPPLAAAVLRAVVPRGAARPVERRFGFSVGGRFGVWFSEGSETRSTWSRRKKGQPYNFNCGKVG